MTPEEAVRILFQVKDVLINSNSWLESTKEPITDAFNLAIEALKEQPNLRPVYNNLATDTISRQAALDCVTYDVEYTMECIKELPSVQPKQSGEVAFWKKRAREYENIIAELVAEQARGIKLDSIQITKNGVVFQKSSPKAYTKADYIMALHKEYGCTLKRAKEAHQKALEYLQNASMMKG